MLRQAVLRKPLGIFNPETMQPRSGIYQGIHANQHAKLQS